jgi:hypothetical protein
MQKMTDQDIESILKRYNIAFSKKEQWRSVYQEAYEYALPQRNLYDGAYEGGVTGSGQKKMSKIFDATAIHSTQRFANRLQSGIFPPQRKWCRLEPGPDIPFDRRQQAQTILDQYTEIAFAVLKQSNFDIAIGEFLLDLAVGTGVMLVQPGDDVTIINFTPVPQYLVAFEEGPDGKVDNVFRKLRLKAEAIPYQWKDAVMPDELLKKIEQDPTCEVDLIEATIKDYAKGNYNYHVMINSPKACLVHRTMNTTPWVVSRYMKVSGEIYGRGPVLTAMPDIKTVNKTVELLLKNASLAVSGVYTAADDGVLNPNTVRIVPGAIIPVARNGGPQGESLKPLPRSGDFNVSQIVLNDLRMNIKKVLLDESLPPDNMSARSATEVVERMKELAQNLGSAFGRLINETMIPIVTRILDVIDNRGLINLPLKVNGLEVRVVPVSPLANAQYMEEISSATQWMQIAQGMAQAGGQEALLAIDTTAMIDWIGDKLGVPATVRRSTDERAQIMEEMQNRMQAAAQAAEQSGVAPEQVASALQGG